MTRRKDEAEKPDDYFAATLDCEDVGKQTGLSPDGVRRLCKKRLLAFFDVSLQPGTGWPRYRFSQAQVDEFLASRTKNATGIQVEVKADRRGTVRGRVPARV
ncbi:hypothetical protein AB1L42_21880 [Thalassoglobus sp. JC818]|uniref:hypothetical protein n=1 Tax=Thalassoglobus sp. JC818 TaxID=3232136 RepID=UPI00345B386D